MKKITILLLLLSTLWGYSQAKNYTFADALGTYAELSGGTVLGNETTDNQKFVDSDVLQGGTVNSGVGLPIGFNFSFNGYTYDRFAVSADGFISLGNSALTPAVDCTVSLNTSPLSGTTSVPLAPELVSKIAGLGYNLKAQGGASLTFQTLNTSPNRVLVVQWKKYRRTGGAGIGDGDELNFQIRLNESSNTVNVVYGSCVVGPGNWTRFQVGLRGEPVSKAVNYNIRKSTTGINNTVAATSDLDGVIWQSDIIPQNGWTYTWTPPTCGDPRSLVATYVTTSSATLNWSTNTPLTTNSYEYIVSPSATVPAQTASGTATTNPTAAVTDLTLNTVYNVFVRGKCGTDFTSWVSVGTFKTLCSDVTSFAENFDTYTASTSAMPNCWDKAGTGSTYITNGSAAPMSPANRLYSNAPGAAIAYAIMPPVSNLQTGTNRLRFTAFNSVSSDETMDVGYFTIPGDLSTFVVVRTVTVPGPSVAKAQLITVPIPSLEGVKCLVFRNKGTAGVTKTIYIDDVVYESTECANVTAVGVNTATDTTAQVTWTKGGTETDWQYVCLPAAVTDPNSVTPTTYSGSVTSVTITGLTPNTSYRVWVRSKCDDTTFGAWVPSSVFRTTCIQTNQVNESFDASSGALPACWTKVGPDGSVSINSGTAPSPGYLLNISNNAMSNPAATVALPPLSNSAAGTHRLRFKAVGLYDDSTIDIGYMDDITDPASYHYLQTVNITSSTAFNEYTVSLGQAPKSPYLVFRNTMNASSTNKNIFIDDVVWEPIPACDDISAFTIKGVTGSTASFAWKAGGSENGWQYVVGNASSNPNSLTLVDVPQNIISPTKGTATVTGLSPVKTYRVWVRSKCGDSSFGAWMGPYTFTTSCTSVTTFSQNFDASINMPDCWTVLGNSGINVAEPAVPASGPNALYMNANAVGAPPAVCAMPPVSNAAAGTHRLRFKVKSRVIGDILKVGYLSNFSDPASFVSKYTYTAAQKSEFENIVVDFGTEPTTEVLAFMIPGTAGSAGIYIDDVIWEQKTICKDVTSLHSIATTDSTVSIAWAPGDSETKWEYAYGPTTLLEPSSLTPVEVSPSTANGLIPVTTISGLSPSTSYKLWLRSKCNDIDTGYWGDPIVVTTPCTPVASFSQNFDASTDFPSCWKKIGNAGSAKIKTLPDAPSKSNALVLSTSSQSSWPVVAMPPISNNTASDYVLKFKCRGDVENVGLEVGYLTDFSDPTSFITFKTIQTNTFYEVQTVSLDAIPFSNILAFRYNGVATGNLFIDDVSWGLAPTAVPACATGITATPDAYCGTYATVISWLAVPNADGYKLTIGSSQGGSDLVNVDLLGPPYTIIGNANTTYYYTVKPYNTVGTAAGCPELSFVTNANKCLCASVPTSKDGTGVTNVTIGATNFAGSNATHYDFTATPVNLAKGKNANLQITFNTYNQAYNTKVYVDFNDNYLFETSELVSTGTSGSVAPNTLDVSFMMSALANSGMHQMRIATWRAFTDAPSIPCYSGANGVTLDFAVNVVDAPINDEPQNPVTLTVGADFDADAITGTNVDATGSVEEAAPSCGNYNGMDVWYKAVIPASGNLAFEINTIIGGIANTAAAAYSGQPGSLVLIGCDDSSSSTSKGINDDQPKIVLTGRTPAEVIYFRVWANGGNAYGPFKVSVYDNVALLGVDSFDNISFSFYPNPVTDVLNLSFNQEISNVSVVNLLGQQVIFNSFNSNKGEVDMSGLSAGTYLVKVAAGNQIKTIKITKQ